LVCVCLVGDADFDVILKDGGHKVVWFVGGVRGDSPRKRHVKLLKILSFDSR